MSTSSLGSLHPGARWGRIGLLDALCSLPFNKTGDVTIQKPSYHILSSTRHNHHPHHHHHHHHHHVPALLQTLVVMAIQSSLLSVFQMSSLLGDSFLVMKLFRLFVYFVRSLPLLLVPNIFPLNICFTKPSALFICPHFSQ